MAGKLGGSTGWNYGNIGRIGPYRNQYGNQMFTDPIQTGFRPDITSDYDPTGSMGMGLGQIQPGAYPGSTMGAGSTDGGSGSGGGISKAGKFGIAAGASVLGGGINLINLGIQKRKFEKAGIQDLVPQATKDALGETTLRANSTRASNYSNQLDNIRSNENTAIGNAQLAATSPDQIQRAAIAAQKNSNRAILNLGEQGIQSQRHARSQKLGLQNTVGQIQQRARQNYEDGLASFYNAKQQQVGNMINGVAGAALMAL